MSWKVDLGRSESSRSSVRSIYQGPNVLHKNTFETPRDKTNKMACAPSEDSDQPGHPPSLIRVFAMRSMGS